MPGEEKTRTIRLNSWEIWVYSIPGPGKKNLFEEQAAGAENVVSEHYEIRPIGVLRCDIHSRDEAPKNYDESDQVGTIRIFPEYAAGLEGVEAGSTIVVLFWLHQADRSVLRVYPRGDRSRAKMGVFATRSPVRPNPVAVSEYRIIAREGTLLTVAGVDVIDQTPVIDIKRKI